MIDMRLAMRMLADPRTPARARIALLLAALYVVLPFDVVPDHLPVYGLFDDIVVVALAVALALRLVPHEVRERLRPPQPANDNGAAPAIGSVAALAIALGGVMFLTLFAWWGYGAFAP